MVLPVSRYVLVFAALLLPPITSLGPTLASLDRDPRVGPIDWRQLAADPGRMRLLLRLLRDPHSLDWYDSSKYRNAPHVQPAVAQRELFEVASSKITVMGLEWLTEWSPPYGAAVLTVRIENASSRAVLVPALELQIDDSLQRYIRGAPERCNEWAAYCPLVGVAHVTPVSVLGCKTERIAPGGACIRAIVLMPTFQRPYRYRLQICTAASYCELLILPDGTKSFERWEDVPASEVLLAVFGPGHLPPAPRCSTGVVPATAPGSGPNP